MKPAGNDDFNAGEKFLGRTASHPLNFAADLLTRASLRACSAL